MKFKIVEYNGVTSIIPYIRKVNYASLDELTLELFDIYISFLTEYPVTHIDNVNILKLWDKMYLPIAKEACTGNENLHKIGERVGISYIKFLIQSGKEFSLPGFEKIGSLTNYIPTDLTKEPDYYKMVLKNSPGLVLTLHKYKDHIRLYTTSE